MHKQCAQCALPLPRLLPGLHTPGQRRCPKHAAGAEGQRWGWGHQGHRGRQRGQDRRLLPARGPRDKAQSPSLGRLWEKQPKGEPTEAAEPAGRAQPSHSMHAQTARSVPSPQVFLLRGFSSCPFSQGLSGPSQPARADRAEKSPWQRAQIRPQMARAHPPMPARPLKVTTTRHPTAAGAVRSPAPVSGVTFQLINFPHQTFLRELRNLGAIFLPGFQPLSTCEKKHAQPPLAASLIARVRT